MIPLSIPHLAGNEWKYVKECLDTGWVSMAGKYVNQFEDIVANFSGAKYGVAAVNGTCGLHMAMHVLGITQNDYVIVPNITFIASANAVAYTNAEPIFVDIDPETWQMDINLLEQFLDEQTETTAEGPILKSTQRCIKAIMPVHVLGNMCNMDELLRICKTHNLKIVEDASESLGSYYKGKHSGAFGDIGVFSFNGNKIITTGGGGVIVTDNEALAIRTKHLTTQAKTNPETYFHDEIGYNYRLVNVLAALGVAQMEQLPNFVQKKKQIDAYYRKHLLGVRDIQFQKVEPNVDPNCWLTTIKTSQQAAVLEQLKRSSIIARPFWTPMNQLPMFGDKLYIHEKDHSRNIHAECLSIPSSVSISEEQLAEVVHQIKKTFQ